MYTPQNGCVRGKDDEPVDFVVPLVLDKLDSAYSLHGISFFFFKVAIEKAIGTHSEYQQSQMVFDP